MDDGVPSNRLGDLAARDRSILGPSDDRDECDSFTASVQNTFDVDMLTGMRRADQLSRSRVGDHVLVHVELRQHRTVGSSFYRRVERRGMQKARAVVREFAHTKADTNGRTFRVEKHDAKSLLERYLQRLTCPADNIQW